MVTTAHRYSLAHLTALTCPTPELVYIAARAGYDFISPRVIYMGLPGEPNYDLTANPTLLKQTRQALAATGVKVHDIELARITADMYPSRYLAAFEVAAELGATGVLSSIWTDNREYAIEKFGEVCDLAKPLGLTVNLEYVPIASVNDLASAVDVLHKANRSNAGLMVDTHHFHRAGDNPKDLSTLPKEWFNFAHICDAHAEIPADRVEMTRVLREERLYLGEGGIDIAAILNAMPKMVYSIELPHLARLKEFGPAEHVFRCLESAKKYMENIHPTTN